MTNFHFMRRLCTLALAAALCLPATASAMPIIDTGPVVTPTPTAPAGGTNALLLVAVGGLAVVVLMGATLRVTHARRTGVHA